PALSKISPDIIKVLLDFKTFTQEQKQQMLFTAIYSNNETLALELIDKEMVDVNDKKIDSYYPTFLLFAMNKNCSEDVILSLIGAGSTVDCLDFVKNTPLHYAVRLDYI